MPSPPFGGTDRVAVWHRRAAVAGLAVLVGHLALVTSPPDPYATSFGHALGDVALAGLLFLSVWALAPRLRAQRWPGPVRRLAGVAYERPLTGHRLTGLFVVVAVVHGAIVDPSRRGSMLLRVVFPSIGITGLAGYVYREVFARYVMPIHDYTVGSVEHLTPDVVAAHLQPVRQPLSFVLGQLVVVAFGGPNGWERHPVLRVERSVAVSTRSHGEGERPLHQARWSSACGLAYRRSADRSVASTTGAATTPQAWIAGGIGVTPVSLIRAIDGSLDRDVQFFYSTAHAAEALHSAEIDAAASAHGSLHVHHVSSDTDGRLKADRVMRALRAGASPWIYMCGPAPMMRSLTEGFPRFPVTCHVGTRFVPTLFPPSLRRVWDHEVAGANLAAGPSGVPGLTG